jgi:hypothetical protein
MHRRVIARLEVKHPRAKIIRAKKMVIFDLACARCVDFLSQIDTFHNTLLNRVAGATEPIAARVGLSIGD